MDYDNREWGRINPVDYVPFFGVMYRIYWWLMARRGRYLESTAEDGDPAQWHRAAMSEVNRLILSLIFTAAFGVFMLAGGGKLGFKYALVTVIVGVFFHRFGTAVANAFGVGS
ncbi:MAG: hypothetical protein ABEK59_10340 [Halobacteria archaeon]